MTCDDERTLNMTLDALNIINALLTSLIKDLRSSLEPFTIYYELNNGDGSAESKRR